MAQDHSLKPLNSLCTIASEVNIPHFICFRSAQPLQPILDSYYYLSKLYWSDLFNHMWTSVLKTEFKAKSINTFPDVVSRIWDPVFKQCLQLIESVHSRTIKLKNVDCFFGGHDRVYICENLRNLYSAIQACRGENADTTQWIQISVDRMEQYWALCEQADAADIVLELKRSLNLTGDFEVIESVASKVTESMKEFTLNEIDYKLIEAKSFLEQVIADRQNLECLRKFVACSNIVGWIRKETTGKL